MGNVERAMQRQRQRQQPQVSGGVVLHKQKEPDRLKMLAAAARKLGQQGKVCKCGKPVEDRGIRAFGVWMGVIGTEEAIYGEVVFCSLECAEYIKALDEGVPFRLSPQTPELKIRLLGYQYNPEVVWTAEVPEAPDDQAEEEGKPSNEATSTGA